MYGCRPFFVQTLARASAVRKFSFHSASQLAVASRQRYSTKVDYESKYAEKLRQLALEKGVSVSELKEKARKEQEEEKRRYRQQWEATLASRKNAQHEALSKGSKTTSSTHALNVPRKDSSPVKPLSSILNTSRVLSAPHTPEQITSLWNAYHMSRSKGTGRGYLCASIPVALYNKMAMVAQKYPTFVVPLRRSKVSTSTAETDGDKGDAYEFYFLQWDFYDAPPTPSACDDLFAKPPSSDAASPNPKISTVLFTPLEEYKLRNTFATPYLVLTNYTELASTHGLVLLRGEITPSPGANGNYKLSQEDAQQLSMAIQRFYLWSDDNGEAEKLLKTFHENPSEFKWEDLLKTADWGI